MEAVKLSQLLQDLRDKIVTLHPEQLKAERSCNTMLQPPQRPGEPGVFDLLQRIRVCVSAGSAERFRLGGREDGVMDVLGVLLVNDVQETPQIRVGHRKPDEEARMVPKEVELGQVGPAVGV